jgi:protein-tyrosine phosphatase
VLTVCTGNICRSPLLERVLQQGLDRAWGPGRYEVTSAGTHGLEGLPMDERAAAVLSSFGGRPQDFVARRLRPTFVADADLVLTATLDQRARVVRASPAAIRYAFTFRELAVLADSLRDEELPGPASPPERLRALSELLMQRRGQVTVAEPDIIDPYRREDEVYAQMKREIRASLPSVLRALT